MNQYTRLLVTTALWLLAALAHASTVTYVYTDPQGTPLAEADAAGNITARFDYTPYGQPVTSVGAAPNGPGYTGHVNDPDTGFVYMQQRYYDAACGCFLSVDPVTAYGGDLRHFNRYAYAYSNPYRFNDPDGRCPSCFGFIIGAGLEVARQVVTGEIKDTSAGGLLKNGAKILVAGGSGAIGAGIGTQVAKLTASVALRAAANGAAGAVVNSAATVTNNVIDGNSPTNGVGTSAAIGGVAGVAGSLVGDGIQALQSAANANARGASSSISLADRNLLDHVERTTLSGSRTTTSTVGAADAAGSVVSNSSGVVESCGAKEKCE